MNTKAKESPKVDRMREKLRKQIAAEQTLVSQEALKHVSEEIYGWLNRHQFERITLKDKSIVAFDSNQHPAKVQSKFVKHLLADLQKASQPKTRQKAAGLKHRFNKA
jgi:hypothetical protein